MVEMSERRRWIALVYCHALFPHVSAFVAGQEATFVVVYVEYRMNHTVDTRLNYCALYLPVFRAVVVVDDMFVLKHRNVVSLRNFVKF